MIPILAVHTQERTIFPDELLVALGLLVSEDLAKERNHVHEGIVAGERGVGDGL